MKKSILCTMLIASVIIFNVACSTNTSTSNSYSEAESETTANSLVSSLDSAEIPDRQLAGVSDVYFKPFAVRTTEPNISGIKIYVLNGWNLNDTPGLESVYDNNDFYHITFSTETLESYTEKQDTIAGYDIEAVQNGTVINDDGDTINWYLLKSTSQTTGEYGLYLSLFKPINIDTYSSIMLRVEVYQDNYKYDNDYWEQEDIQALVDTTLVEFTDNYVYSFPD